MTNSNITPIGNDNASENRQGLVPVSSRQHAITTTYNEPPSRNNDGDDEIDLRELWSVIRRRKGTIFVLFALISLVTLLITLSMTPVYRASVTLEIDTEEKQVLDYDVEARATTSINTKDFYQTQYELLKSRNLAERVIDKLRLESYLSGEKLAKPFYADTLDETQTWLKSLFSTSDSTEENQETLPTNLGERPIAERLLGNVTISPVKNSQIVTIHYDDKNPEMAATIANAIADSYINMNLERRASSTSYAKEFLESQLLQAKSRLEETESNLVKYAKEKELFNTNNQGDLVANKLEGLSAALTVAEKDRITAESEYQQAQKSRSLNRVQNSMVIQQLKASKATLQIEYQEKLKIYKPDYPLMLQIQEQLKELNQEINRESSLERSTATTALEAEYKAAKQKEDQLREEVEKYKDELLNSQDKSIGYNTLRREVETNRELYEGLLQRFKEVNVAGLADSNNISVVDPAIIPYSVHKPNVKLNVALGMVLGLFAGTVVAFLLEFMDDRVKTNDDISKVLPVPTLGIAPHAGRKARHQNYALMTVEKPTSAVAEAFRSLRTNLMFSTRVGAPKILNITSSDAGEGKSSTSINLATAFAQAGKTVLLIDADLRKPTLHKHFKLDNSKGLANFLVGQENITDVTQACFIPDVYIVTAGPLTPNPVELLSSERLADLVTFAESPECEFDIVILDSPPVLGLADALVIGNRTHATLMVAAHNQVRKRQLQSAFVRLRQAHTNIIGVIMTKAKGNTGDSYYNYDYYYSYGDRKEGRATLEKKAA